MRFITFKSALAAVVITAGALGTHAAKAETLLNVPFSFTVAGQAMPAGVYTVQQDNLHNVVVLRNHAATKSFTYTLRPGDQATSQSHVTLKFEADGESHILRSIQVGSKETSRLDSIAPTVFDPARLSQGR
jgi:hypothetical protein